MTSPDSAVASTVLTDERVDELLREFGDYSADLPLGRVFGTPTIGELLSMLAEVQQARRSAPVRDVIELPDGLKVRIGGDFKLIYKYEFLQVAGPVKGFSGAERRAAQLIREAWNKLPDTPSLGGPAAPAAELKSAGL